MPKSEVVRYEISKVNGTLRMFSSSYYFFIMNHLTAINLVFIYLLFGLLAEYCTALMGVLTLPNQMLAFFLAMMGPFTLFVGLEIEIMFMHIGDNTKITTNQEILHSKRHLLFETAKKKNQCELMTPAR